MMTVVTCSVHKEPVAAAGILHRMIQEVPDSVVIAYIGRSNGAGGVQPAGGGFSGRRGARAEAW